MNNLSSKILENVNLKDKNTLHLNTTSKQYFEVNNPSDLEILPKIYNDKCTNENIKADISSVSVLTAQTNSRSTLKRKLYILGEGSNTLFADEKINTLIVKMNLKGKEIIYQNEEYILLKVCSGELFRDLVIFCCKNNWSGLENLAAIYGTVGAAAVQNIGAYGAQIGDCIESCSVLNLKSGEIQEYKHDDCFFGYRDSVFKQHNHELVIVNVTLKLKKSFSVNCSYKALKERLEKYDSSLLSPMFVAEIVTEIRNEKLPDPEQYGNCGSFFMNPVVSAEKFEELKKQYPLIPSFDDKKGVKLSAGWLISSLEEKDLVSENVSVYAKQKLVLINNNDATAKEIIAFAGNIAKKVKEKFGVSIFMEPVVVY